MKIFQGIIRGIADKHKKSKILNLEKQSKAAFKWGEIAHNLGSKFPSRKFGQAATTAGFFYNNIGKTLAEEANTAKKALKSE